MTHLHPRSTSRDIAQHVREAEGYDYDEGVIEPGDVPEPRRMSWPYWLLAGVCFAVAVALIWGVTG